MAIPLWVLGKHLTALSITPLTEDADGNLAYAAGAQSVLDTATSVRLLSNPMTENISAVARPKANHVILEDDTSIAMTTHLTRRRYGSNTKTNVLPWFVANYDHCEITFTRGPDTWTGRFVRGQFSDGIIGKGANPTELMLLQVDDAANPLGYTSG